MLALLAAALFVRGSRLASDFDRGLDGERGARHAILARGLESSRGQTRARGSSEAIYASFGRVGDQGRPLTSPVEAPVDTPRGSVEGLVRLPFLLAGLLALFALHRAVRASEGAGAAMLALAFFAALPISSLYGTLPGDEWPALACALLGAGICAGERVGAGQVLLFGIAVALATFFDTKALVFLAPLLVHALAGGATRAMRLALAGALAAGIGAWARSNLMIEAPALTVSGASLADVRLAFGGVLLFVALGGALFGVLRIGVAGCAPRSSARLEDAVRRLAIDPPASARFGFVLALLAGGLLASAWTARPHHPDPRPPAALLWLAPGVAACAATAVALTARPLFRLRAGLGPLVLLASAILFPGLVRVGALERELRAPGPADDPQLAQGPREPLPRTRAAHVRALLPEGALGLVPEDAGPCAATAFYARRDLVRQSLTARPAAVPDSRRLPWPPPVAPEAGE